MTKVTSAKLHVSGISFASAAAFSRVQKAFELGPIDVQRDHRKRAPKANYIGRTLKGDMMVFHAVIWKGQERLLDGYTRVERIVQDLTDRPDNVVLVVHNEVFSLAEVIALYDQFNSSSALKRSSDRYDEGLRLTDMVDNLKSPLVLKGPKSAAKMATNAPNIREGVTRGIEGIRFVDSIGLDKNGESVGLLAAYYAIGTYAAFMDEEAKDFIRKLNQIRFEPKALTTENQSILKYRNFYRDKVLGKSATGGTNVIAIRDKALTTFVECMGFAHMVSGGFRQLTLGEFISLMKTAKSVSTT